MAYNTDCIAEQDVSLGHEHIQQDIRIVEESPIVDRGTDVQRSHSKSPRTVSPLPLFGSQDPTPTYRSGSSAMGQETKKLIVSTCRAIVKLESNLTELEAKSPTLEQHRLNGIVLLSLVGIHNLSLCPQRTERKLLSCNDMV